MAGIDDHDAAAIAAIARTRLRRARRNCGLGYHGRWHRLCLRARGGSIVVLESRRGHTLDVEHQAIAMAFAWLDDESPLHGDWGVDFDHQARAAGFEQTETEALDQTALGADVLGRQAPAHFW